jgi:DNA polymerase III subunit epsilon
MTCANGKAERMTENKRITTFICFDIETTGLSPEQNKIIEIGALKVKDGKVIDKFSEFINPGISLPENIIKLTGITDQMLSNVETEEVVVAKFIEFAEDYILLGHNIMFDYSFTKVAAKRIGLSFEKSGLDTLIISRKLLKDLESKSLTSLCKYYGIENKRAHRAYEDARATALLYVSLCNEFYNRYPEVFLPGLLNYKVKKTTSITSKQKNYLLDLIKYHNIDYMQSLDELSQSEASKAIDKIILSKGRII